MWSPDRRTLVLLPLLAACGFTPAYGPAGAASALRNRVSTGEPTDRAEFDFVRQIEERLGRPEAPFWRLDYTIRLSREGVAITTENAVTRFNLIGRADWKLVPLVDSAKPLQGVSESFTSWSATGSTVAVLAAEEDAEQRLMRILADQVSTRLIAAAAGIAP
jgi:LPS-assembly lipoprotein